MVPFRRLSGEHQHSVILDNVITCSGARSHSKRAAAKRDAGHKAAISHFGQVKLQLANPETVKKVKLSDSQGHSKTTACRPTGGKSAKNKTTHPAPSPLVPPRPRVHSSPCLGDTSLRQDLLETMWLYHVSRAEASSASADLIQPEDTLDGLLTPHKSQDFAAAGVIAISFWPPDGHIRVLLAQEPGRKSNWHKRMVKQRVWEQTKPYGIPGGKRHRCECRPGETALREVTEETAGLLSADNFAKLPTSAVFLSAPANYYAFLMRIDDQNELPEKFAKLLASPKSNVSESCTTKALAWVPVRDLARWPRSHFFDKLLRESVIPAWLCAQQREYDRHTRDGG